MLKDEKGSLSIEASLVLPVCIIFILLILSLLIFLVKDFNMTVMDNRQILNTYLTNKEDIKLQLSASQKLEYKKYIGKLINKYVINSLRNVKVNNTDVVRYITNKDYYGSKIAQII